MGTVTEHYEVYYLDPDYILAEGGIPFFDLPKDTSGELLAHYVYMGDVEADDLDDLYLFLNSWSCPPGHPKRPLCEKAQHTSMSIGDVARDKATGKYWICDKVGWQEIFPMSEDD